MTASVPAAPQTTVDISDMAVSSNPDEVLVTYALGSCLGICIHDPVAGVSGLLHCMLPLSKMDAEKAARTPLKFVDTGTATLFRAAYELGAAKERIVLKVAGGARVLDQEDRFRIGERNYAALRKVLWKNSILIAAEDVGGSISRTVYMEAGTGRVLVKTSEGTSEL